MVERYRPGAVTTPSAPAANMFLERKELTFLPTGCTLLECVIGGKRGGWPFGRIINIIGDKSTGKTLLAEEAMVNFIRTYKKKPHYRESESAFNPSYFQGLGGDPSMVDFGPQGPDTHWQTIEQVIDDLTGVMNKFDTEVLTKARAAKEKKANRKKKVSELEAEILKEMTPSLYIIDSLDALTSSTELKRDIHEGSYNLEKQKLFGEFMRKQVGRLKRSKICLMIISQTRDRIGAMIRGKQYRRHCDQVLDFYCSVVLYLAQVQKISETHKNIKRTVGIKVRVKGDKNKIAMPHRECVFDLIFGYGIDDEVASLQWLKENKRLGDIGLKEIPRKLDTIDSKRLREKTIAAWCDIEDMFVPAKGKYS